MIEGLPLTLTLSPEGRGDKESRDAGQVLPDK